MSCVGPVLSRVSIGVFLAGVAGSLVVVRDQFQVPNADRDELLGLLGPLRPEIVEVESPKTGTTLPDSFEPAPPLA